MLWGFGLVMLGYVIGFIPWVADLVTEYIDIILLIAVGGTALVTLWHYFRERSKAKKAAAAGEDIEVDDDGAQQLVLDPEVFERGPAHPDAGTAPKG
jgi:membrane-associated protein